MKKNEVQAKTTDFSGQIENLRDIERIREVLQDKPRDLLFFDLAIHTGAPAVQLLRLKVKSLSGLQVGDQLPFIPRRAIMNEKIFQSYTALVIQNGLAPDEYLFKSRKGSKPLTLSTASRMVSGWLKAAGLKDSGGVLTLRKTWQFHHRDILRAERTIEAKDHTPLFKRIEVSTVQERVFSELQQAIISGRIAPGKKISSREIAELMGVSQIPVREALGRLEALGFISTKLNKGSVVKELSKDELRELSEIRMVVESLAAERAAKKRSAEDVEQLELIHDQFVSAWHNVDDWLGLNKSFHFAIYRASRMPILLNVIEQLWDKYSPYLHILYRTKSEDYIGSATAIHKGMLEGMSKGDPGMVCKWLIVDLKRGRESIQARYELFKKADK